MEEKNFIRPAKPHFFQPFFSSSHHDFSIPISFLKYLSEQECKKVVLRGRGGKLWHVKVKGRSFKDGWEEFVRDHDLHVGDILVFEHERHLVFDVVVFDLSTCERDYPLDLTFQVQKEEEVVIVEDVDKLNSGLQAKRGPKKKLNDQEMQAGSSSIKCPHFLVTLKASNVIGHYLTIPIGFARKNGLAEKSCEMILKNGRGMSWQVSLRCTRGWSTFRTGWKKFVKANRFRIGDVLRFKLIKGGKKPVLLFKGKVISALSENLSVMLSPSLKYRQLCIVKPRREDRFGC